MVKETVLLKTKQFEVCAHSLFTSETGTVPFGQQWILPEESKSSECYFPGRSSNLNPCFR